MAGLKTVEVPIRGMDCADCTRHVQHAIANLPGVDSVDVFLSSEKAVVHLDVQQTNLGEIRKAVEEAGYSVAVDSTQDASPAEDSSFSRSVLSLLGLAFGAVLFVVVVGEWLGFFETVTNRIPWPIGLGIVLVAGFPVFRNVLRATLHGQVIAHTLMSVGVLAALAVGQWATAAVVVFFMRMGDYAEHFTSERARRAVKDLSALAPQTARLERDGQEVEVPVDQVQPGDTVVVRPGEKIPVDGEVVSGQATIDQAAITGESMPVEAGSGARVFAATFARLGSLRVRAVQVGSDSTFGRVIRLVEEAEAQRAEVQRVADRFSSYYLPVVAGVALLTYLLRRDPLATAAVLVVACSCSFALATPIAILASIGAGARRGLMIKGGKYLELLSRADVLLLDKTGTLTLGKPEILDIVCANHGLDSLDLPAPVAGLDPESKVLWLAASAERYSEHPLATAVRQMASRHHLALGEPQEFQATPGLGVQAKIAGQWVSVGSQRLVENGPNGSATDWLEGEARRLEGEGKTLLFVLLDGRPLGILAAADTLRQEVPQALREARRLGIRQVELLTGDNPLTAASLAEQLGIAYQAGLLPEDKIRIVKEYQAQGHTVLMVGDGVNDAPALAQADVGIAMGAAGSGVAIEAAHVALMREDWDLVPQLLHISRRTLRTVKINLAFTALYNLVGLSLAALGFLPPILAAAAQSLPDLGILANSSRLLRQ
ncbi:MAG: cation-translocating P-type ATPase [Anaerolineales bacterium]|jgi:Cu+-exporting ATPase